MSIRTLIVPVLFVAACGGPAGRGMKVAAVSTPGALACDRSTTQVHGIFKESDGSPIADATVVVAQGGLSLTAITDDAGCYAIDGLAPGPVELTLYYINGSTTWSDTIPRQGTLRVDAAAFGRVGDPFGEPIQLRS